MKKVTTRRIALSMVRLGHHKDLVELRTVKAFDLRLPMLQDGCDSLYCLERPIAGKRWEIHQTGNNPRLLDDSEALKVLEAEQLYIADLKKRTSKQTKHLRTLRNMMPQSVNQ